MQLIDDATNKTIISASSLEKDFAKENLSIKTSEKIGELIAKRALDKKIDKVVFDKGGYIYHGRIKALADSARKAGLKFNI